MIATLNDTVSQVVPLVPWIGLAKVTALLLVLFGVSIALRRSSAAARHVLWTAGLVGLVAMPILSMQIPWHADILPMFSLSSPNVTTPQTPSSSPSPGSDKPDSRTPESSTVSHESPPVTETTTQSMQSTSSERPTATRVVVSGEFPRAPLSPQARAARNIAVTAWLVGILFVLLRLAIGVATLGWFAGRAKPAGFHQRVASLCAELGIRRHVRVLLSPLLSMPVTWGFVRPVILLPAESESWGSERLRAVLLHELSHVRRGDALWHTVAQIACAVYWFHPLVWLAVRRHELECEQACDAMVTEAGISRKRYATHLIGFARRHDFEAAPATLMPMARRSQLGRRLETLLAHKRAGRLSPQTAVALVLAVAVSASSVAALRADTEEWKDRKWGGDNKERRGYAHNMFNKSIGTFVLTDDGYTMAKWKRDGSTYSVEFDGTVHVNEDDSRIASISPGGFFIAQEVDGKAKRRYEAFPDDHGSIIETFYESENADHLGDPDEWLANVVLLVLRETGLDARRRVERILAAEGPDGVFSEIGEITSDNVKVKYFAVLFDSDALDKGDMETAVEMIGTSIQSDGDKTALLINIAGDFVDDPELTRQFFETTETIGSDGDRRRLISALFAREPIAPGTAAIALRSIGSISSDGDQSDLLAEAATQFEIDGDLADAFFEALRTVQSDGDHARVLQRLIERGDLTVETQRLVLVSAATIHSDGDLARVLVRFAETIDITEATSDDYFAAVDDIASDGDHARVLVAVSRQSDPPAAVRMALLESTSRIGSDGDKAEVLVKAAPLYRSDNDLREAYLKTAESIASDGDYRRVMRQFNESDAAR